MPSFSSSFFHQLRIAQLHHDFIGDQEDLLATERLSLRPHLLDGVESEEKTVGGRTPAVWKTNSRFRWAGTS